MVRKITRISKRHNQTRKQRKTQQRKTQQRKTQQRKTQQRKTQNKRRRKQNRKTRKFTGGRGFFKLDALKVAASSVAQTAKNTTQQLRQQGKQKARNIVTSPQLQYAKEKAVKVAKTASRVPANILSGTPMTDAGRAEEELGNQRWELERQRIAKDNEGFRRFQETRRQQPALGTLRY
jgi:hypothetical protein